MNIPLLPTAFGLHNVIIYNLRYKVVIMEFYSSLDINEIKRRMTSAVNNDWMKGDTLRGKVTAERFWLRKRPKYLQRNSASRLFYGTLRPERSGTIITGSFKYQRLVVATLLFWFVGVTAAALPSGFYLIKNIIIGRPINSGFLIPVAMLLFGILMVLYGSKQIDIEEEEWVINFIKTTLEANETQSSPNKSI